MEREAIPVDPETIDRRAVDAFLYGVSKGLSFLGEQKKEILDTAGDLMLEYLIDVGRVASPDKPQEFVRSLGDLLAKNGFESEISVQFRGSPPAPSVTNFVALLGLSRDNSGKVDWVLYEMILYGVTKALDQLGAQAQIILNRIGAGLLDYLVEIGAVEPSADTFTYFERLREFFIRAGYAKDFEFGTEGSPVEALLSTWTAGRYYSTVYKRLRNEESALLSCPLCLAGSSIMARVWGVKLEYGVDYKVLPGNKVFMRTKVFQPTERFDEKEAEKVSQQMG